MTAINWLLLAREAGHPRASFELGKCYLSKLENYEQALRYLEMFSALGPDADALGLGHDDLAYADFCIGNIYFSDQVVGSHNREKAVEHYNKSGYHWGKYGLK